MSIIGKLFGSDKALEKVVDTGKELLDEAFYTDQEKAADRGQARDKAQGMVVEWMQASTGSRLARRIIALSITTTWLALFLFATFASVVAVWATGNADQLNTAAALIDDRAERMSSAVMLILGFYFAAPYMGDLAKGALAKFNNNK